MKTSIQKLSLVAAISTTILLTGCDDDDMKMVEQPEPPAPVNYSYQVKVTNLTNAQPMSPVAVVLHNEGNLWTIGEMASVALEKLAESGDNSEVLAAATNLAGKSGTGMIMPGMSETIDITITDEMATKLSLATMLVNTNDAFTGVNAMMVSNLTVGESISLTTSSYDAGTEKNSESMASIPGPAAGGEGYNEMRDDVDMVAMHPGVVSQDDGLTQSALTQAHRFDNPTLAITVMRTE